MWKRRKIMQIIQCEKCGSKELQKKDGVYICSYCGAKYYDQDDKVNNNSINKIPDQCPICGEKEGWVLIENGKKGFSAGKALIGGFILGPIGLVAGALGKKTSSYYCKKCGFKHDYKS